MHVGLSLFIRAAQTHNMHGQQRHWEFCMHPPPPCLILLHSLLIVVAVRRGWGEGECRSTEGQLMKSCSWATTQPKNIDRNITQRCSVVLLNLVMIHTWTSPSSHTWHHRLHFFQAEPLRKAGKDFKLLFVVQWSLTEFLVHNNLPAEHFHCFSQSLIYFGRYWVDIVMKAEKDGGLQFSFST